MVHRCFEKEKKTTVLQFDEEEKKKKGIVLLDTRSLRTALVARDNG